MIFYVVNQNCPIPSEMLFKLYPDLLTYASQVGKIAVNDTVVIKNTLRKKTGSYTVTKLDRRNYRIDGGDTFEGCFETFCDNFGGVSDHAALVMSVKPMFGDDVTLEWTDDGKNWVTEIAPELKDSDKAKIRAYLRSNLTIEVNGIPYEEGHQVEVKLEGETISSAYLPTPRLSY